MKLPMYEPEKPPAEPAPAAGSRIADLVNDPARAGELSPAIVEALKKVYDPEIPVDIYELGLIYDIIVDAASVVGIRMTLTAPNCPAAQYLPNQVEQAARSVEGVSDVHVDVVFDPPWDRERMSDAAKLQLGMW